MRHEKWRLIEDKEDEMKKGVIVLMGLALVLGGCAKRVVDEAPPFIETTILASEPTSLEILAQEITDSLLLSKTVLGIKQDAPAIVYVESIKNKTAEHIDMALITQTISEYLLVSGKFQFVDLARVEIVRKQLDFHSNAALVNPGTAIQFGKMLGAKYMLSGHLTSRVKKDGTDEAPEYTLTLRLMELETGLIEWSDHALISQVQSGE